MLKKSTTDAIRTATRRAIQKTAEATADLIGNKIADKITNASTKYLARSKNDDGNSEIRVPKKDTYFQKKGSKLLMN